jgi:hypothetical protein
LGSWSPTTKLVERVDLTDQLDLPEAAGTKAPKGLGIKVEPVDLDQEDADQASVSPPATARDSSEDSRMEVPARLTAGSLVKPEPTADDAEFEASATPVAETSAVVATVQDWEMEDTSAVPAAVQDDVMEDADDGPPDFGFGDGDDLLANLQMLGQEGKENEIPPPLPHIRDSPTDPIISVAVYPSRVTFTLDLDQPDHAIEDLPTLVRTIYDRLVEMNVHMPDLRAAVEANQELNDDDIRLRFVNFDAEEKQRTDYGEDGDQFLEEIFCKGSSINVRVH